MCDSLQKVQERKFVLLGTIIYDARFLQKLIFFLRKMCMSILFFAAPLSTDKFTMRFFEYFGILGYVVFLWDTV